MDGAPAATIPDGPADVPAHSDVDEVVVNDDDDGGRTYVLDGVQVAFPFEAYPAQLDIMTHCVQAMKRGESMLLESPTGTGKTICLLSAIVAWQRHITLHPEDRPDAAQPRAPQAAAEDGETLLTQADPQALVAHTQNLRGMMEDRGAHVADDDHASEGREVPSPRGVADDDDGDSGSESDFQTQVPYAPVLTAETPSRGGGHRPPRQTPTKALAIGYDSDVLSRATPPRAGGAEAGPGTVGDAFSRTPNARVRMKPDVPDKSVRMYRPPQVFFTSRTQKQIKQAMRELRRLRLSDTSVTMLGSKEHLCIHPKISKKPNRAEACDVLLKKGQCAYLMRLKRSLNQAALQTWQGEEAPANGDDAPSSTGANTLNLEGIMDMEDLLTVGRQKRCCPYYLSRELAKTAAIVFSPYQYILNPMIREATDIRLDGAVVILDEAHNVEEACTEAASVELSENSMDFIQTSLLPLSYPDHPLEVRAHSHHGRRHGLAATAGVPRRTSAGARPHTAPGAAPSADPADELEPHQACKLIIHVIRRLLAFMTAFDAGKMSGDHRMRICVWADGLIGPALSEMGLDRPTFTNLQRAVALLHQLSAATPPRPARDSSGGGRHKAPAPAAAGALETLLDIVSSSSFLVLKHFIYVLSLFWDIGHSQTHSFYRLALLKRGPGATSNAGEASGAPGKRKRGPHGQWRWSIALWCLNPGVVFRPIAQMSHSILLASGTLTPMASFASELSHTFHHVVQAPHVIRPAQLWAGLISVGPRKLSLTAKYSDQQQHTFQDELGYAIGRIAQKIPQGVLVFLPSYHMLDTLVARWTVTGCMAALRQVKQVFQEQAGPGQAASMDALLSEYTSAACDPRSSGALLLCVYRGRLSEGIDFTDGMARGVIAVGIPYPNVHDRRGKEKRSYNDRNPALLSGSNYYECLAFRAYNQALGRCIRHRDDWGAMILLDGRLQSDQRRAKISLWIRGSLRTYQAFEQAETSLSGFLRSHTQPPTVAQVVSVLPVLPSAAPTVSAAAPPASSSATAAPEGIPHRPLVPLLSALPDERLAHTGVRLPPVGESAAECGAVGVPPETEPPSEGIAAETAAQPPVSNTVTRDLIALTKVLPHDETNQQRARITEITGPIHTVDPAEPVWGTVSSSGWLDPYPMFF